MGWTSPLCGLGQKRPASGTATGGRGACFVLMQCCETRGTAAVVCVCRRYGCCCLRCCCCYCCCCCHYTRPLARISHPQLSHLLFLAQVEDFLSFNDQETTSTSRSSSSQAPAPVGGLPGRVIELLSKWSRQAPSKTLDPVTSWSAVIAHRQDCFKAIEVR